MPYGLYISAEGAHAQSKRLEVLSNNLANVDTPGFKRDLATFQARYAEETQRGLDYPGSRSINDLGGGVLVRGTQTDFSPGTFRHTNIDTDMAIDGDAYFVVRKGNQDLLTRAGNFTINGNGELRTQDGYPVLAEGGAPVTIDPTGGPWHVTPEGGISQAGSETPLALVRPASTGDLTKAGDNLFRSLTPTQSVPAEQRHVQGGYLEQSGVRPTVEMMELIEASRAFEANATMIRNQDQMLNTLINRVLKS